MQSFIRKIYNLRGWHTNRKIIIFESDDWGSIRMPSKSAYEYLIRERIIEDDSAKHFYKYDSLESNNDLTGIFDILSAYKDFKGNHPVFTGVNVVANPDFDLIRESNFEKYFYQPFTETLQRYSHHDKVLDLWKEGSEKHLFIPQFHGREHLNVNAWMRALQKNSPKTRRAFDLEVFGLNSVALGESSIEYLAAFDLEVYADIQTQHIAIKEGITLFTKLMGYSPTFFVPPNGPFNLDLENTLAQQGIKYIMLNKFQKEPLGEGKYKNRLRYLGKINRYNQIYLSRNASFEPSASNEDWIDKCMAQIKEGFSWKQPVTIGTHRVNYVGYLYPENRDNGLNQLKGLLQKIIKTWPDVEFMSSDQLGEIIRESK